MCWNIFPEIWYEGCLESLDINKDNGKWFDLKTKLTEHLREYRIFETAPF
jgi:hypothetical protein